MEPDLPEAFHPMFFTVEVVLYAVRGTNERRNVIHYHYTGAAPSTGELGSLLDDLDGGMFVNNLYPGLVALGTTWYLLTAQDKAAASGAYATKAVSHSSSYSASTANNSNVSLCLTKRTAIRRRYATGRFYMIDCPENEFDNDQLNVAFLAGLTLFANALKASRVSGRFQAAVGSRKYTGSNPITTIDWDFNADSQRRRLRGRGI